MVWVTMRAAHNNNLFDGELPLLSLKCRKQQQKHHLESLRGFSERLNLKSES